MRYEGKDIKDTESEGQNERIVMRVFDKNGIPIYPKDVLKVFHFVGSRRKKYYMYKMVDREENGRLVIKHLSSDGDYKLLINGARLDKYEVVQGFEGVQPGCSFEDRERMSV